MSKRVSCLLGVALIAVTQICAPGHADAAPASFVFPGMKVHTNATNLCTLGFVDPSTGIAFTAGHCRGDAGAVTDTDGNVVGNVAVYRSNTANGKHFEPGEPIFDYAAIRLASDVTPSNVLPTLGTLVSDPGVPMYPGESVCHYGVITGQSCGMIDAIENGWFTMAGRVVGEDGDSGGPVYVIANDGTAVIVGLFIGRIRNGNRGSFLSAVSWPAVLQEFREDS